MQTVCGEISASSTTALPDRRSGTARLYHRERALAKAEEHATHFVQSRLEQAASLRQTLGQPPVVVSPYDAELFGHWWFEGPHFLDQVIRKTASSQSQFKLAALSDVLEEYPNPVCTQPAASSWGEQGYQQVWLNERTQWLYRHRIKRSAVWSNSQAHFLTPEDRWDGL
jgi:1,4-alpha-glucan branching enzyme